MTSLGGAEAQFEQHVRAICGLPLGDTSLLSRVVTLNLLGDSWLGGGPDWLEVSEHPSTQLHVHGRKRAKSGWKTGHLPVLDDSVDRARYIAESIAGALQANDSRSNDTSPLRTA